MSRLAATKLQALPPFPKVISLNILFFSSQQLLTMNALRGVPVA